MLSRADPSRGRFRSFVKAALRNFAVDLERKRGAQKRGGNQQIQSIDGTDAMLELADRNAPTPDQVLDRDWRAALVQRALDAAAAELEASGRTKVFAVFRDYFLDASPDLDYQEVASRHGITKVDVSNYLARAKNLYRSHLKSLVMETVHTPEELEEELHWLFGEERK